MMDEFNPNNDSSSGAMNKQTSNRAVHTSTRWDVYLTGIKRGMLGAIASAPFGLLFGVVAADNGLSSFDAFLMSAMLYAGASQLVGMDLFGQHVAAWMILLSIFAVNFRHVLYSASTGRRIRHFSFWQKAVSFFFLTDISYTETEKQAESGRPVTFIWYIGVATPIYLGWIIEAYIGATFGNMVGDPRAIGFDMLLPVYFLGMVMGFRQRDNWLPVVFASSVTSIIAYFVVGSPWHVTIGAIGGIIVAVVLAKPLDGKQL